MGASILHSYVSICKNYNGTQSLRCKAIFSSLIAELTLNVGTTPVIHMVAYKEFEIIMRSLDIPVQSVCNVMLIYYCYDAILPPSHILKLKPFARNFLFIFSKAFVTIFVIVYAQFLIPYQNDAKTRLRQKYPSVPSYMLTNDALIIDDPTYSYVWLIATISIVVVIEVVLMIAMTTYCFYCMSRGNGHHCQKTLAIRRKFLISIVMQVRTGKNATWNNE
ncbi:hypothetical protein ANCCEY_04986 [Ancylostoma ceylanicum]|uniref:Uncharacterized protein n=1 Tax=Ancylostoma ceylanicum TaxID=53326 RepID=A0A0D6LV48_9BILA|nr:hypothetical protein ANCCEY_04986 [Ancylostoma ceylanicum]